MIKAIAIDDEPPALKVLENFCGKTDFIRLEKTFTKPNEATTYLQKNAVDLLFLDINMPSVSGIDFFKSMQDKTMVIFTTAYSEHAVEGFNLNAVDYLLKPYTFERFTQAVTKARDFQQYMNETGAALKHLVVKADYSLVKIDIANIQLIEGLDDYLKIHLANGKPIIVRMTMKAILEKLPEDNFVRVHRSYIVPLNKVENVRNKNITIAGQEIPIGNSYEEHFFKAFGR